MEFYMKRRKLLELYMTSNIVFDDEMLEAMDIAYTDNTMKLKGKLYFKNGRTRIGSVK